MERENSKLKKQLDKANYTKVYRDNEMMSLELKNMYILLEENKDLKKELTDLRTMDKSTAQEKLVEENAALKRRNGELLIENEEMKLAVRETK